MADDTAADSKPTTGEEDKDKGSASLSTSKRKEKEPSSEILQNFSRVTPSQLAHISFSSESRFQPVRPLNLNESKYTSKGAVRERYAGGGGILLVVDKRPGEEVTYVELPSDLGGDAQPEAVPGATTETAMAVDDVEEAEPPAPFQVS